MEERSDMVCATHTVHQAIFKYEWGFFFLTHAYVHLMCCTWGEHLSPVCSFWWQEAEALLSCEVIDMLRTEKRASCCGDGGWRCSHPAIFYTSARRLWLTRVNQSVCVWWRTRMPVSLHAHTHGSWPAKRERVALSTCPLPSGVWMMKVLLLCYDTACRFTSGRCDGDCQHGTLSFVPDS